MTARIFRSCFLAGLAVVFLSCAMFLATMTGRYEKEMYFQLSEEIVYVAHGLETAGIDYLDGLETTERLTLVAEDGTVLYDNVADPSTMENHADREEIIQAQKKGTGQSTHLSNTLLEKNLYYAVQLDDGSVLRISCTRTTIGAMILGIVQPVLWILVLALVVSGFLASRLARQIIKPINNLDLENPQLDESYSELFPLLSHMREQNRTISRQMEALSRRGRELSALAENMNEGVLLLDIRCQILSGNQSAFDLLGGEPSVLRQSACPPPIWDVTAKALSGERAESFLSTESKTYEILASPVTANGHVSGVIILMVDVTEREEREHLRREFSANVSHELKTPLTSISGFAELMKDGLVPPETMQEFAGDIYKECSHLIALVDDILKLSRLDEASPELMPEEVDLYTLSDQILKKLQPIAEKHSISLNLTGTHQAVTGIRRILDEMVYNLCDNAIKYNKKGGCVTVSVTGSAQTVSLSVSDTGIGIPEGQEIRVFERFYRVDKSHSRRIGGTGLGLSIVKHGAQYHNAELTLQTKAGVGTTITITFPIQKEESI